MGGVHERPPGSSPCRWLCAGCSRETHLSTVRLFPFVEAFRSDLAPLVVPPVERRRCVEDWEAPHDPRTQQPPETWLSGEPPGVAAVSFGVVEGAIGGVEECCLVALPDGGVVERDADTRPIVGPVASSLSGRLERAISSIRASATMMARSASTSVRITANSSPPMRAT